MKNLLKIFVLFFSIVLFYTEEVGAFGYTPVDNTQNLETVDEYHRFLEKPLLDLFNEYNEENFDMEVFRQRVFDTIKSHWGWNSEITTLQQVLDIYEDWVARVEWDFFVIWCWNFDIVRIRLTPPSCDLSFYSKDSKKTSEIFVWEKYSLWIEASLKNRDISCITNHIPESWEAYDDEIKNYKTSNSSSWVIFKFDPLEKAELLKTKCSLKDNFWLEWSCELELKVSPLAWCVDKDWDWICDPWSLCTDEAPEDWKDDIKNLWCEKCKDEAPKDGRDDTYFDRICPIWDCIDLDSDGICDNPKCAISFLDEKSSLITKFKIWEKYYFKLSDVINQYDKIECVVREKSSSWKTFKVDSWDVEKDKKILMLDNEKDDIYLLKKEVKCEVKNWWKVGSCFFSIDSDWCVDIDADGICDVVDDCIDMDVDGICDTSDSCVDKDGDNIDDINYGVCCKDLNQNNICDSQEWVWTCWDWIVQMPNSAGIEEQCDEWADNWKPDSNCTSNCSGKKICVPKPNWYDSCSEDPINPIPEPPKRIQPSNPGTSWDGCWRYIYWYKERWTPCVLNWNWNWWVVDCLQVSKYDPLYAAWGSRVDHYDDEWNYTWSDCRGVPSNAKLPSSHPRWKTVRLLYKWTSCFWKYADWNQKCIIAFKLESSVPIDWFDWLRISNFRYSWACKDQTNKTWCWQGWLVLVGGGYIKNNRLKLTVKSFVPFISKDEPSGMLSFKLQWIWNMIWGMSHNLSHDNIFFKKPLKVRDLEISWAYDKPAIWRKQFYNINLEKADSSVRFKPLDVKHYLKVENIKLKTWYSILDFNINNSYVFDWIKSIKEAFWLIIDSNKSIKDKILWKPAVRLTTFPISYKIASFWPIKYNIESNISWLKWCGISTQWLLVEWWVELWWKSFESGQDKNFSDLSSSYIRNKLVKNINNLIKWQKSGTKVNSVYYFNNWDIKLQDIKNIKNWDTIVVKNWNLILDEDIDKNIWIAVIYDRFNIKNNNTKWNIYVKNTIRKINAIIYADGSFLSAKADWSSYEDKELEKNLVINWNLFTQNTVWWASAWVWKTWASLNYYLLPGWYKPTSWTDLERFKLAKKYDLNLFRNTDLCSNWYNLKVKSNNYFINNIPKGFWN